jgi:3-hydroxyisobutyrate dehydrogenase
VTRALKETVALVGLGSLGSAVAARIREAGLELLLYDVDQARAADVAAATGGRRVPGIPELADASIVVCLLPDTAAVDDVVRGQPGLLGTLGHGSLVIDMGSSDPHRTIDLADAAAAVGVEYADAPVSGGLTRARAGDLTVMFGGTEDQLARALPILDAVGSTVVPVGKVGAAHAAKALNNLLSAIGLAGALEVLEVAQRFGLDPELMLEIVNGSSGRNNATETKIKQFVLSETFASGFALGLMLKDVTTAIDVAREVNASTPLGDACLALWRSAADELPPDADHTSIASLLLTQRELAGRSPVIGD